MVVSLKFNKFQNKSISLPSRSHPSTLQIKEQLSLIKSSSLATPTSIDNICNSLSQLVELHHLTNDLLVLPVTQNLISFHRNTVWVVEEVMEASMKLLDICSIIRDLVSQMAEHVRDLECALRRRKKDHKSSIQIGIANYIEFRKKTKKEAKELITRLKQSEKVNSADLDNHKLPEVMRVVMEINEVTVSIFESLLIYVSVSVSVSVPVSKVRGWSFVVWKMMHKGIVACKEDGKHKGVMNELEGVDVSLVNIYNGGEQSVEVMQMMQLRLEGMEARMQRIEGGLECIFRVLVKTRASLLNIMSL